jgi:integrase
VTELVARADRVGVAVAGERLSPETVQLLAAAVPPETRRAYAGDWKRFTAWCLAQGRVALPANIVTVTEYTRFLIEAGRAPSTIDRALAAIAVAHDAADLPKPNTKGARQLMRGHKRQRAEQGTTVRKASAVTVDRLRAMALACDPGTGQGLRDRAVVVLGFALASRRSELARLDLTDIAEVETGLDVTIRTSKTDKESAGRTVALPYGEQEHPETCPVRTLRAWREWLAEQGHTHGPLFRRIDRYGVLGRAPSGRGSADGRLTGQGIAIIVNRVAAAAGLDPALMWTGHSLRRGFATEAYRAGADPLRIARHGGWIDGSSTLLGYVEEVDRWKKNPLAGVL